MTRTFKTITLIFLISTGLFAKEIYYKLAMPEPHTHLFAVEMRLEGAKTKEVVALPVWTPGSYLIREYAKNVQDVTAYAEDGTELSIRKQDKNHWEIKGKRGQDIIVKYQVYSFEHSVRTSYLDSDHALVVPASVLMYWENNQNRKHHLHIDLPESWSTITTALKPFNKPGNVDFIAADYDELADSPLELGNHKVLEFEVLGKPHVIGIYGYSNYVDSVIVNDFSRIMETEAEIFGGLPYDRYAYILHLEEGRGGLEHAHSSVNFIRRWSFNDDKRYKSFLALIAHEFFHTWNIKRLYPTGVATFDYDAENYLDELWMAEGVTSYYDELILQRIGIKDNEEYLEVLKDEINTLERRPGKHHQSVADASWDAWIKYYRTNEHSSNSTVSYYNKGHLLGLLLDIMIIDATNGKAGMDEVIATLYTKFAEKNKPYTTGDVQRMAEQVSGLDLSAFFRDYVYGVEPLPYAEVLELAGVMLDSTEDKESELGVRMRMNNGKVMITNVREGSPAWDAGLSVHDELLALDGFRVKSATPEYMKEKTPGDRVVCTVSRKGVLRDIHVTVGFKPVEIEALTQVETPSAKQKLVFEKWLRSTWEEELEE